MPYYVHKKTVTDPAVIARDRLACRFTTARGARECLITLYTEKTHKITFIATPRETEDWQTRERERFDTGDYLQTPWAYGDNYPEHYAHLSLKTPGLIAYTKYEEHGVQDRQTTVKPGKYLTEFYTDRVNKTTINQWIADCSNASLKIASTPDDIEAVYMGGPGSCMDGKHWDNGEMHSEQHPARVYGMAGSDLAVAYYGPMQHASARCVIWPERKIYTRIYGGATVLKRLLEYNGYENGTVQGAKVPAIADGSGFLMPYIDYIKYARLKDRKWIVFDNDGPINVQNTHGISGERECEQDDDDNYASCNRCEARYEYDNEGCDGYCDRCYSHRTECAECDNVYDDRDHEFTELEDSGYLCTRCAARATIACAIEDCDHTWIEATLDRDQQEDRAQRHTTHLCADCDKLYQHCHVCAHDYRIDLELDRCPACQIAERCIGTVDLFDNTLMTFEKDVA